MGVNAILNPAGQAVTCFCQVLSDKNGFRLAIDLGKAVVNQSMKEYPEAQIRCGIGTPANNLNEWQNSFREAGLALDTAFRLDKSNPLYFPHLSVYRLLLLLENNPELEEFQNDMLGKIIAEEGKNKYIETLEAYFRQQGNLSQTANALFIHRNTLAYRMERIKEISGLDLDDHETALAIQLALRIHRLLRGKKKNRK